MNILVTGSNGFIGKHVVRHLEAKGGHEVEGLDWPRNLVEVGEIREFDAVVNLAAIGGVGRAARDTAELVKNNVGASIALRGALRQWEGYWPRVVHVSSFSVYGDAPVPTREDAPLAPKEMYGASKLMQEQCWIGYPGRVTTLRLSSVYGSGMDLDFEDATVIAKIARAKRDKDVFRVFEDGKQVRDFVHVRDVCDAILAALTWHDNAGRFIVNVCSGKGVSIEEACVAMGTQYEIIGKHRDGDMKACVGDPAQLIALIGRQPSPFTPQDVLTKC